MSRDPALLLDMLLAARKVLEFAGRTSRDDFLTDEFAQSAIQYQIQIIGEAAFKLSNECREQHPQIEWKAIAGLRHRLVHDYAGIEPDRIWDVVENHVPELIRLLEPLVPPESTDES